jgi:hypothetical protein
MIVYDMACGCGHRFEGWFKDRDTFDNQLAANSIPCPLCGGTEVTKLLTAPHVAKSGNNTLPMISNNHSDADKMQMLAAAAQQMRRHVEENCENVGESFPEEARKIHYGETEHREIYGTVQPDVAKELHDEGVPIQPLPFVVKRDD